MMTKSKNEKKGTTNKNNDKRVSFGSIEVIEFEETIGDNPTTLTGVPISLGKQLRKREFVLETYESSRKRPRTMEELRLSPQVRFHLAMGNGGSLIEIEDTYKTMVNIQRSRANCISSHWRRLVAMGLEKTFHSRLILADGDNTEASWLKVVLHPRPPLLQSWERDARDIHSTRPRA